jgi:D-aminopeptidase
VAVKKGIGREVAVLRAPEETRPLLTEGARKALDALPDRTPLKPDFPIKMRMRSRDREGASLKEPWFTEREMEVHNGLDIISGTASA